MIVDLVVLPLLGSLVIAAGRRTSCRVANWVAAVFVGCRLAFVVVMAYFFVLMLRKLPSFSRLGDDERSFLMRMFAPTGVGIVWEVLVLVCGFVLLGKQIHRATKAVPTGH
jgi:hypothetical protein